MSNDSCRRRTQRLLIAVLVAVSGWGCGQDVADSRANSQVDSMTGASSPEPSMAPATPVTTTVTTETIGIEFQQLADANGITPEEARDMVFAQARQAEALEVLWSLVEPDLIVEAAFSLDFTRANELTVYVIDSEAIEVVSGQVEAAGLDPTKTTVEVFEDDEPSFLEEHLHGEPYNQYEWLATPDPQVAGVWQLIESQGDAVVDPISIGFGTSAWEALECSSELGQHLTSADQTVSVTIDLDRADCGDSTGRIEQYLAGPVAENRGRFEVEFYDQTMIWVGADDQTLIWQRDELDEPHEGAPASALSAWMETPAPDMEGIWTLTEIGAQQPAAAVTLYIGVSTWNVEGLCNSLGGLYAMTRDGTAAFAGMATAMYCENNPTMRAEEQIDAVMEPNRGLFEVSVEGDSMTWRGVTESELVWQRTDP